MNCNDFETRIQELLDRRQSLTGDGPLLDHALICSPCAALLETYQELFDQVASWQPPELDKDFGHRTVRKAFPATIAVRPGSSSQHRYSHQVLTVLACLVLIAVLGRFWLASISTNRPISDSEISPPQSAELAESPNHRAPMATRDLLPLVTGPRGVLKEGAGGTIHSGLVHGQPRVAPGPSFGSQPWPVDDRSTDRWRVFWTEWSSALPVEPLESLGTWTQGIKPIAASLNTALDSLRATFPLYDPSSDLSATEDAA